MHQQLTEEQAADELYEDLEALIDKAPKKDLLIVMGDWNAQIREDINHHGYGVTTERGVKLLEFAERQKLIVANTLHRYKTSRRITWHTPDGVTQKQTDYILVPKKFKSSVNKAKTRNSQETRNWNRSRSRGELRLSTKNRTKMAERFST